MADLSRGKERILRELFKRYEKNPILTYSDWPYPVNAVFNPGAVKLPNGEILLLVRVEDRVSVSHLTVARSRDGVKDWEIDNKPTLMPDPANYPEEAWGIEDPRITWIEELENYVITYTSYSQMGPAVSLALTRDFNEFERLGLVMLPHNKDAALFPRRFNGKWLMIHRPFTSYPSSRGNIWLSSSPDLRHWGIHSMILEARSDTYWESEKIGLNTPPIETTEGWLIIYHGVQPTPGTNVYRLGLALLDLESPEKVIRRGDNWIFGPKEPYEQFGNITDVVFPCGAVVDDESGDIKLYYGAADTRVALATSNINILLEWLKRHGSKSNS